MPIEKKVVITTVDADGEVLTVSEAPIAKEKAADLTGLSAKGIEELIRAKARSLRS